MENVDELKEKIRDCMDRLWELRGSIRDCEDELCRLNAELFLSENRLGHGQRFSIGDRVYVAIESDMYGFIRGRYITKSGDVSRNMTSIPHSDYSRIHPLPMEK